MERELWLGYQNIGLKNEHEKLEVALREPSAYKEVKLHVLGAGMQNWIVSKKYGVSAQIVTIDLRCGVLHYKFGQQCLHPRDFSSGMRQDLIFNLSAGSGNDSLLFGPPGYEVRVKKHTGPRGRMSVIWVRCPISITEDSEGQRNTH